MVGFHRDADEALEEEQEAIEDYTSLGKKAKSKVAKKAIAEIRSDEQDHKRKLPIIMKLEEANKKWLIERERLFKLGEKSSSSLRVLNKTIARLTNDLEKYG